MRLNQEQENFRSAVAWSLPCKKIAQGLQLVGALHHYWWMNFNIAEAGVGARRCSTPPAKMTPWRTVYNGQKRSFPSGLLSLYSSISNVRHDLRDSLRIYQKIRDDAGAGAVLCFLGIAYFYMNDSPRAIRFYQEALRNTTAARRGCLVDRRDDALNGAHARRSG